MVCCLQLLKLKNIIVFEMKNDLSFFGRLNKS